MKKRLIIILWLGILAASFILLTSFEFTAPTHSNSKGSNETLKKQAFQILDANCNVCHRKKNPFMVFKMSNMEKRAYRINKQVFVLQRMPKGDEITLSVEDRATLKNWLNTQNINN